MAIYGYCPRWEDFYLVVCDVCNQSVKPQALKQHIGKFTVILLFILCIYEVKSILVLENFTITIITSTLMKFLILSNIIEFILIYF